MIRFVHSLHGLFPKRRIEGPRVFLRPPRRRDVRQWVTLRKQSHAFLQPWEPEWSPELCTRASYFRFIRTQAALAQQDRGYTFFVFRREDRVLLGSVSVGNVRRGVGQTATLGYWIGEPHARQGYMREALTTLIPVLFERMRLHRIEAATVVRNVASRRLLETLGFQEEGRARRYLKIAGQWQDHVLFAMLEEDPRPTVVRNNIEAKPGYAAAVDRGRARRTSTGSSNPGEAAAGFGRT